MEQVLIILLGAGVLALVPSVPILRRLGKSAIKGSIVVAEVFREPATKVGHDWREMVDEAKAETKAAVETEPAALAPEAAAEPVRESKPKARRSRARAKK